MNGSTLARIIGIPLLLAATVGGIYATFQVLANGHQVLNATQYVPWGIWVSLYIFFLGISSGSLVFSTLIYVFGIKKLEPVGPLALFLALTGLVLGGFFIMVDLGHPIRAYYLLLSMNPTSVMAWMGVFYSAYSVILLWSFYLVMKNAFAQHMALGRSFSWLKGILKVDKSYLDSPDRKKDEGTLKTLGILGIPVAILQTGGVGTIFALAKGRETWNTPMLPILFMVCALVSGAALITFLTGALSKLPNEKKLPLMHSLVRLTLGILAVEVVLLLSEILVGFYSGIPHEIHVWSHTMFGDTWWIFWIMQVAIGIGVPLYILFQPRLYHSIRPLTLLGFSVMVGVLGTRYNIVIPAQLAEPLEGMVEAHHHFRYTLGYLPSLNEVLLTLFGFALMAWAIWFAVKVLPLAEGDEEKLFTVKKSVILVQGVEEI